MKAFILPIFVVGIREFSFHHEGHEEHEGRERILL